MQSTILMVASTMFLVHGQSQPTNPPTTSTVPPTTTTNQSPTDATTTTAAPLTYPTYQCPNNPSTTSTAPPTTTTTAAPPTDPTYPTYPTTVSPTTTSTYSPTTTTDAPTTSSTGSTTTPSQSPTIPPSPDSCLYPPQCNISHIIHINITGPGITPVYDQILTPSGDHNEYDSCCSTLFPLGNYKYLFVRCITTSDGNVTLKRYVYAPVDKNGGFFRGQGLSGENGCDTCVFNDYYIGEPCSGFHILRRCYLYGDCVEEYGAPVYIGFSSTEFISNQCYGPLEDLIGTNYTTLPRHYNTMCCTKIGNATAMNAERVPVDQRLELTV